MTSARPRSTDTPDLTEATRNAWDAGQQPFSEGWRQAQQFWNSVAGNWGEAAGIWLRQNQRQSQEVAALRELQDAAVAAGQAWLRLPSVLLGGGARESELPQAISRLAEAQGHAVRLWLGTLTAR
jgi:hypothetical protein